MAGIKESGLHRGPLGRSCTHICVDMQRMFHDETSWHTPWMRKIVPQVSEIARRHAAHTIFTRFLPAQRPGNGVGAWRGYYERWSDMTIERLGADMIRLIPELEDLAPPAVVLDKWVYSPWYRSSLEVDLRQRGTDALVVTGGETDVCVLATVLGALDAGFRVVLAADAICSSADQTHDALLELYNNRFGQQLESAATKDILRQWDGSSL